MEIQVKEYTYEDMPDYTDPVEGAMELEMTGEELGMQYFPDVVYDREKGLRLQLILPYLAWEPNRRFPCVVFVQGSAWGKQNLYGNVAHLGKLAQRGFACAIVEYRHSGIANFPAQIVDAKNAVRYLKANSEQYRIQKDACILMGDSSGGHTSVLAGMTSRTELFDEPINGEDCTVKGIIDLYGAVDVTLPCGFPSTVNHQAADSPEGLFMGYDIRTNRERARAANAKEYVNESFPPMLILHGTKDRTVFCQESVDLYEALKRAGKDASLYLVRHADHGGPVFWSRKAIDIYEAFIARCLVGAE